MAKLDTGSFGEFGVQRKHLDGEGYLVDDTLAGTVAARKKFEVFDSVVPSCSIYVMDGFSRHQVSSEMFSHDVSVLHDGVAFAGYRGRDRYPHVAVPLDVAFEVPAFEASKSARALAFGFAFFATKLLLSINATSWFAISIRRRSALGASKFVSFIGIFAPTDVRTMHGAIQRVVIELFSVCSQVALHHGERFVAFLAGERNWRAASGRKFFFESVFAAAFQAAKLAAFFGFIGVAVERLFAVFTRHLDRHGFVPSFGDDGSVAMPLGDVK